MTSRRYGFKFHPWERQDLASDEALSDYQEFGNELLEYKGTLNMKSYKPDSIVIAAMNKAYDAEILRWAISPDGSDETLRFEVSRCDVYPRASTCLDDWKIKGTFSTAGQADDACERLSKEAAMRAAMLAWAEAESD